MSNFWGAHHTGRGRGLSAASYRAAMTQMTMGGAGANAVSGVLSEASCRRCGAWRTKKRGRPFLVDPFYSNDAGSYSAAGASSAFGASAFLARLRRVAFFSALGADARAASLKSTNSMRAISEASP